MSAFKQFGKKPLIYVCFILVTAIIIGSFAVFGSDTAETKSENNGYASFEAAEEASTNRHTTYTPPMAVTQQLNTEGFQKKMESDILELWYKEDSASVRIVDKRSGYIWGCLKEEKPEGLNKTWSAFANSLCTVTYFDDQNVEKSIALSESGINSTFEWNADKAICALKIKKAGISLKFEILLDNDKLTFNVIDDTIFEVGNGKLKSICFLSFLGSSREDEISGYFFIPDGSGALIRFNKSKNYNAGYEKRFYGSDYGIDESSEQYNLDGNRTNDYATETNQALLPIYGIVHGENQNAILTQVDTGAEYAYLRAMPAGVSSVPYNWATVRFDYRQLYRFKVSDSSYVSIPQEELNSVSASITYNFLTGEDANYSGMARRYASYLEDSGILSCENDKKDNIPFLVNIMGSEVKKGLLSNNLSIFTTVEQARNITFWLSEKGIDNQIVMYSGWLNGGYSGSYYYETSFEKKVGSYSEFLEFKNEIEKSGGSFLLSADPITANEDQINIKKYAALSRSKNSQYVEIPNNTLLYNRDYFIKPSLVTKCIETFAEELSEFDFHYENIGTLLYSDYTRNKKLTRTEVLDKFVESLSNTDNLYLDQANLYMLRCAQAITDMPMVNSQFMYETDTVPFLQLLLKGRTDYYAPYLNKGFYSDTAVLKMVEYGAYPSFVTMYEDNFELFNTPLENWYSLNFEDWKNIAVSVYERVDEALSAVEGSKMVEHKIIDSSVAQVKYDNGISIIVNYRVNEYTFNDIVVPACSYIIWEE